MAEEGAQQVWSALQGAGVMASDRGERLDIPAGEIREGLGLEVAPHVLDGIELRRVRRERDLHRPHDIQERGDAEPAVRRRTIPDQRERRPQLAGELLHEGQHRGRIEVRLDQQLEVQPYGAAIGTEAQGGDGRHLLPMPAPMPQHRCEPTPAPGAAYHRQQQQAAFVDEHEPRAQSAGFCLMRGQSCLIQRWIPASSRSHARRVGRCGVQPSERSRRPM